MALPSTLGWRDGSRVGIRQPSDPVGGLLCQIGGRVLHAADAQGGRRRAARLIAGCGARISSDRRRARMAAGCRLLPGSVGPPAAMHSVFTAARGGKSNRVRPACRSGKKPPRPRLLPIAASRRIAVCGSANRALAERAPGRPTERHCAAEYRSAIFGSSIRNCDRRIIATLEPGPG